MHHSDPTPVNYYNAPKFTMAHNPYPYPSSASMAYRTYSNESATQRASPQTAALARTPSLSVMPTPSAMQPSPSANSSYSYSRPMAADGSYQSTGMSPQQRSIYPSQYYPQAAEMPRSLSYPSYAQPYPSPQSYPGGMHNPSMPFARYPQGYEALDMGMRNQSMGYSFANRLPLVDRPFKCDECVQSFNRNHDLKRHKRIHLAVKPFGCDKCGKTFSRKDALRRHWLVKGCRGEDGATAPIVPMFPINVSRPPPLSPSSGQESPVDATFAQSSTSATSGTAAAPAPLQTLPTRQLSDNQIIVTPDELADSMRPVEPIIAVQDNSEQPLSAHPSQRDGSDSVEEGYFDVGVKTAVSTTFTDGSLSSPAGTRENPSPTSYRMIQTRSFSPTQSHTEGKPVYSLPFTPTSASFAEQNLLVPTQMEKQGSADGADSTTWQRWHRPSFPFPPPPGGNYHYDPSTMVDVTQSRTGYTQ